MVQCIDHHYTRRGLQQVFDVERTGIFRGSYMRELSIVRVAFPDESPMRALLNGTVDRVTGGSIEYFYRIHASGNFFKACLKIISINFISLKTTQTTLSSGHALNCHLVDQEKKFLS
jgi:hypothetical protein